MSHKEKNEFGKVVKGFGVIGCVILAFIGLLFNVLVGVFFLLLAILIKIKGD